MDTIGSVTAQDLRDYVALVSAPEHDADGGRRYRATGRAFLRPGAFGDLRNTSDLAVQEAADLATAPGGSKVGVDRGPWSKVYLGIAWPVPGYKAICALSIFDILSYLMGGDATSFCTRSTNTTCADGGKHKRGQHEFCPRRPADHHGPA